MPGKFKLAKSKEMLKSRVFTVQDEQWTAPDGGSFQRHTIYHPGAVAVIPFDAEGNILLVKQFRPAAQDWLLEIPAGTLEKGEVPLGCAKRELVEEIGFAAKKWKKLGAILLAPGYSNEVIHIFKAWDLMPGHGHQDDDEYIEKPIPFSPEQLKKAVKSGKVRDAKTLSAMLYCELI